LTQIFISLTLVITGFLCVLNVAFAVMFRKRRITEILSYIAVGLLELGIFVFALLLRLGILTHVPYELPPGLPFNRAEIGAAIAIGIGLFPAAYWHRTSVSQVRERMAHDAHVLKQQDSSVRVRSNAPGEWMN
jgi:ABC-type dipeptide/oligopeptide/nickel transport system permease component